MENKNKNNSGAIFKNKNKTKDTQPDYKGKVTANGKEMEISLWIKESSKDGSKFFSVSLQEPFKKTNQSNTFGDSNFRIDSHDDLF